MDIIAEIDLETGVVTCFDEEEREMCEEADLMLRAARDFLRADQDWSEDNTYFNDLLRNALEDLQGTVEYAWRGIWSYVFALLRQEGLGGTDWQTLRRRILRLQDGFRRGADWDILIGQAAGFSCRHTWLGRAVHVLLAASCLDAEPLDEQSIEEDTANVDALHRAYQNYLRIQHAEPKLDYVVVLEKVIGGFRPHRLIYRQAAPFDSADVVIDF